VVLEHETDLAPECGNRARAERARVLPFTITWPRVGRSSRAISRSTVLLPAPEWPVRKAISPASRSNESSERASRPFG
jgi:hypothetical protein